MQMIEAYENNPDKLQAAIEVIRECRLGAYHQTGWEFISIAERLFEQRKDLSQQDRIAYQVDIDYEKSVLAYYVNLPLVGLEACENIIHSTHTKTEALKQRTLSNLVFYVSSIIQYCDAQISEIMSSNECDDDNVSFFTNPSVTEHCKGLIYNLRGINYQFDIPNNCYNFKDVVMTTNFLTLLRRNEWLQYSIERLSIETSPRKYASTIIGYEDIRLFCINQSLFGIATCREHSSCNRNQMCLIDIAKRNVMLLQGDVEMSMCEKNWSPLIMNQTAYFIYSYSPLVVLRCDVQSGLISSHQRTIQDRDFSSYRGGTQFIPMVLEGKDGFLGVIHQVGVRELPQGVHGRYYYHRFVFLTFDGHIFHITSVSLPFYFVEKTIEFASGICCDSRSQNIILTFGFEDKKAYQITMPVLQIERLMHVYASKI